MLNGFSGGSGLLKLEMNLAIEHGNNYIFAAASGDEWKLSCCVCVTDIYDRHEKLVQVVTISIYVIKVVRGPIELVEAVDGVVIECTKRLAGEEGLAMT